MKREMCVEVGTRTLPAKCPHYGGTVSFAVTSEDRVEEDLLSTM